MNLKTETGECLAGHGKTFGDIKIVCGDDFNIPVDNFLSLADTEYDNGFGGQEVARDLTLIGDGFVMIRTDYDGAEAWRYIDTAPREKTLTVHAVECHQAKRHREKRQHDRYLATGDLDDLYADCEYLCSWSTLAEIESFATEET